MTYNKFAFAAALVVASGTGLAHDGVVHDDEDVVENVQDGSMNSDGDRLSIGAGYYQTYVKVSKDGVPEVVGVKFPKKTLDSLPSTTMNDGKTCYDLDQDDKINLNGECVGGHSRTLYFNSNLTPFKNVTINWEPHGHVPAGVYDDPHFDFHFYMISDVKRKLIIPGPCPGLMNCAQASKAMLPVPDKYVPSDYFNTELVFAHMGNHYVDGTSPELNGGKFTHTFILGSYNSEITFYEPMLSRNFLLEEPRVCAPIKTPAAFAKSGYYPTKYCINYNSSSEMYRVSLQGFIYRLAN